MENTIYRLIQTQNGETKAIWWGTITQIEAYLEKQYYFNLFQGNIPDPEGDKKYSIEKV